MGRSRGSGRGVVNFGEVCEGSTRRRVDGVCEFGDWTGYVVGSFAGFLVSLSVEYRLLLVMINLIHDSRLLTFAHVSVVSRT